MAISDTFRFFFLTPSHRPLFLHLLARAKNQKNLSNSSQRDTYARDNEPENPDEEADEDQDEEEEDDDDDKDEAPAERAAEADAPEERDAGKSTRVQGKKVPAKPRGPRGRYPGPLVFTQGQEFREVAAEAADQTMSAAAYARHVRGYRPHPTPTSPERRQSGPFLRNRVA